MYPPVHDPLRRPAMTEFRDKAQRLVAAMEVPGLEIPTVGVRFFQQDTQIPEAIQAYVPQELTLASCQACKQAGLGDPVLLC